MFSDLFDPLSSLFLVHSTDFCAQLRNQYYIRTPQLKRTPLVI